MKPKVSIIVPIYNVEKYLKTCIESILFQNFKEFELLLINDGSTDNSAKICDEYKKKDSRIKVYNKKNGGLSDTRNWGIKYSKAKYIAFIDGDDFIEKDMFKTLYKLIKENNLDIAMCTFNKVIDNKIIYKKYTEEKLEIIKSLEAIDRTLEGNLSGYSVCNKLYKKNLFKEIKFPKGRIYEDAAVFYKLYGAANRIGFINIGLYNYVYREGSITRTNFTYKRFDVVENYNEMFEYFNKNYPQLNKKIENMYFNTLKGIILDIAGEKKCYKNYNYILKASNLIKKDIKIFCTNDLISKKNKILANLIIYMPFLVIMVVKLRKENLKFNA